MPVGCLRWPCEAVLCEGLTRARATRQGEKSRLWSRRLSASEDLFEDQVRACLRETILSVVRLIICLVCCVLMS